METTAYSPNSPYAASKASADHLACAWHATYGIPTIVSNCSNNYGPYHFPEKLIPLAILNGIEGKPIPIYGDGLNIRDWLHVEDHARALYCILTRGKPGEKYNVGADSERTNIERGDRDLRQPRSASARRRSASPAHHAVSRTGPATTGAMRSTRASCNASWSGAPKSPSRTVSMPRCGGTSTMNGGGGRFGSATAANASA